jgi:two-component system, cell cycle response regulator
VTTAPLRLLVADDDPTLLRLLERLLPTWGYEVSTATSGNEAWARLQEPERPALALLDWSMPGVQGPEICRRLRAEAREPYVYVLLLTAKYQQEDLAEAIQAGADDFVRKPFNRAELQARLWAGRRIVEMHAELARNREMFRTQALYDVLTGLWNRRAILDALERELARARRGSLPVAVALVDLDHFKRVNDTYGHAAGDSVLKEAATRMAGTVRPYDPVGRYGGEEFLVILPGCDEAGAQRTMERVRTSIAAAPVVTPGGELRISCSIGVACASLDIEVAPELLARAQQDLLQRADEALYAAKRNGRNRVEVS